MIFSAELYAVAHFRAFDFRVQVEEAVVDANIATRQTQILLFDADTRSEKPIRGNVMLKAREIYKEEHKSPHAYNKRERNVYQHGQQLPKPLIKKKAAEKAAEVANVTKKGGTRKGS